MNLEQNPCAEIGLKHRIRECILPTPEEMADVTAQLSAVANNPNLTCTSGPHDLSFDDLNTMRLWHIMRRGIDSHSTKSPYRCWNCQNDFTLTHHPHSKIASRVMLELKGWNDSDENWNITPQSFDFSFAREQAPRLISIRPFPDDPNSFSKSHLLHHLPIPPHSASRVHGTNSEDRIFTSDNPRFVDRRHLRRKL